MSVMVAVSACGDDDGAKPPSCPPAGTITLARVTSADVDQVSRSDDGVRMDATPDWAFRATVNGAIADLVLLSTDVTGKPTGGQQWDTVTGADRVPAEINAPLSSGASSWVLGIVEKGKLLNGSDGSITALSGCHELTLFATATSGTYFRLYAVAPDGTLTMSPVIDARPDAGAP